MGKKRNKQDKRRFDRIVSLMSVYLSEWKHRDSLFWSQIFKLFYGSVIISFVPNLSDHLGFKIPTYIHSLIFPVIGIVFSLFSLYVAYGYACRLKASGDTYRKLMHELPEEFYQDSICDLKIATIKYGKLFSARLGMVLPTFMFLSLIIMNIFVIIYH